jgi:nucleoside-diphosphate-sugar epimerase
MELMRDLVLITGSSGLIGTAAARRLAGRYDVIGLDTKPPKRLEPMKEHVYVDLTKDDSVQTALRHVRTSYGDRVASFIHLAAYYDFSGEPSPLYKQVTIRGTERLLRELKKFQLEQFLFSSSMLVHAPCEKGQRIDEDSPLEPKWDYPKSKTETEYLLREQRGTIPVGILRIAGVYDDRCHSIPLANQIQRIFERRLISHVYPGDTSRGQAFVHLDDVIDAFELSVNRRASLPDDLTALIGEPETLSYDELQRELARLIHDEEWETRRVPKPLAKAGAWLQDQAPGEEPFIKPWMIDLADDHYALDISRARSVLGWEPKRSLRSTLPIIIGALRSDPLGWYRENKLETSWLEKQLERQQREEQAHAP